MFYILLLILIISVQHCKKGVNDAMLCKLVIRGNGFCLNALRVFIMHNSISHSLCFLNRLPARIFCHSIIFADVQSISWDTRNVYKLTYHHHLHSTNQRHVIVVHSSFPEKLEVWRNKSNQYFNRIHWEWVPHGPMKR